MRLNDTASQHGCVVVLGRLGILILGESGSGKSELAARLVGHWQNGQSFASWVADDRVYLSAHGKHIVARVPQPIAGLAECRFSGIVPVKHLPTAIVDLAVCLHPMQELDRLPVPDWISLNESAASVPLIRAPRGDPNKALELVEVHIRSKTAHPAA